MKRQSITAFEEAERYIAGIPRFTSKNTMEDTKAFLHRLGDPDRKLRIIHVAGTNGKGSVCAYLRGILEAAGYRTALFTSPHLVDIRERFTVDGEMVSRGDFLRAFLRVYHMLDWDRLEAQGEGRGDAYHPTFFEFLFFMAMVLFSEKEPDFCILETGLGGRLDATNAVGGKMLSVITHISLDHVEILGDTVEKIAWEKAGIMQQGVPVVFWDTCPETTAVFQAQAEKLGISAYSVSKADYSFSKFKRKTIDFCVNTEYDRCIDLTLGTIAAYQMENCTLAVRAARILAEYVSQDKEGGRAGKSAVPEYAAQDKKGGGAREPGGGKAIGPAEIRRGVEGCFWPGRMEEVFPEFYVDGAHNEDGIRAFLETVAADGHEGRRTLLFAVVRDKDYRHMAESLAAGGLFDRIATVGMRTGRGLEPCELEALFGNCPGCVCQVYESVALAVRELLRRQGSGERIYAAGSLYLVGEIKELAQNDKL